MKKPLVLFFILLFTSCATSVNTEKASSVQVIPSFLPEADQTTQVRHIESMGRLLRSCEETATLDFACEIPPFDFRYNLGGYDYCLEKAKEVVADQGGNLLRLAGIYKNLFDKYDLYVYGTSFYCPELQTAANQ